MGSISGLMERPRALAQYASAVSNIRYFYEQGTPNGASIHLGVVGEIALPSFRVLCMLARAELRAEELAHLGELGRKMLHKPFSYLSAEVTAIWNDAEPGKTVEILSQQFSRSLHVYIPTPCDVPQHFMNFKDRGFRGTVEYYLFGVLEVELQKSIGQSYQIVEDESRSLALAA